MLDVFFRQIVGWSFADHIRDGLVADALQMATWKRRPEPETTVHTDRLNPPSTPLGCSATGCARPAFSARWAESSPPS